MASPCHLSSSVPVGTKPLLGDQHKPPALSQVCSAMRQAPAVRRRATSKATCRFFRNAAAFGSGILGALPPGILQSTGSSPSRSDSTRSHTWIFLMLQLQAFSELGRIQVLPAELPFQSIHLCCFPWQCYQLLIWMRYPNQHHGNSSASNTKPGLCLNRSALNPCALKCFEPCVLELQSANNLGLVRTYACPERSTPEVVSPGAWLPMTWINAIPGPQQNMIALRMTTSLPWLLVMKRYSEHQELKCSARLLTLLIFLIFS